MVEQHGTEVTEWTPDAAVQAAVASTESRSPILILPSTIDDENIVFPDSVVLLGKEFAEEGVEAEYLGDGRKVRKFQSEFAAHDELWYQMAIGVAANAEWSTLSVGLTALFYKVRKKFSRVRVRIAQIERNADGVVIKGIEIEGPADHTVERCMEEIRRMVNH